jgi:hypothetical protein
MPVRWCSYRRPRCEVLATARARPKWGLVVCGQGLLGSVPGGRHGLCMNPSMPMWPATIDPPDVGRDLFGNAAGASVESITEHRHDGGVACATMDRPPTSEVSVARPKIPLLAMGGRRRARRATGECGRLVSPTRARPPREGDVSRPRCEPAAAAPRPRHPGSLESMARAARRRVEASRQALHDGAGTPVARYRAGREACHSTSAASASRGVARERCPSGSRRRRRAGSPPGDVRIAPPSTSGRVGRPRQADHDLLGRRHQAPGWRTGRPRGEVVEGRTTTRWDRFPSAPHVSEVARPPVDPDVGICAVAWGSRSSRGRRRHIFREGRGRWRGHVATEVEHACRVRWVPCHRPRGPVSPSPPMTDRALPVSDASERRLGGSARRRSLPTVLAVAGTDTATGESAGMTLVTRDIGHGARGSAQRGAAR